MLIKKITTAMLMIGTIGTTFADVCSNIPGKIICGSGDVDHISGNGVVNVSGTNIKGLTSVNGSFTAHNSNLIDLDVNGTATLTQCLVNGTSSIKGTISANETKFASSVDLHTESSNFRKSIVNGDLTIKKTSDENQKIYLENSSEVAGDVIFETGHGEIILSGDSKVKGNVIGATIINK